MDLVEEQKLTTIRNPVYLSYASEIISDEPGSLPNFAGWIWFPWQLDISAEEKRIKNY